MLNCKFYPPPRTLTLANVLRAAILVLAIAISAQAEIVEFFSDFSAGSRPATTYQQKDVAASLAPYYPNFSFYDQGGGSNLRYLSNDSEGYIKLAAAGEKTSFELTASSFVSSATCFDLTAGDLVYEAYYACNYHGGIGGFNDGISINNTTMTLIYHPGYSNGAFRIDGSYGTCNNQNIGFTPPEKTNDKPPVYPDEYTKMKLTIHRNEASGNYEFKTELGLATSEEYSYTYNHTCPIAIIDADGGIKSIGPYAYNSNNNCVTNLYLQAPFADNVVNAAKSVSNARDELIADDRPVHWYKFDDPTTNTVTDYGSNPKEGTSQNVNMSTISELNQVASFIPSSQSKVSILNSEPIFGSWTAELLLNSNDINEWQTLLAGNVGGRTVSLRWSQYPTGTEKPGFTISRVGDYVFKNPDGGDFDYEIPLNQWLHVAYVNDEGIMRLYIDGELVGVNDVLKNYTALQESGGFPLAYDLIGTLDGTQGIFNGMIDYIALYNYALSDEQIWNHANPIPEPTTWALMALGALGLLYWRRRSN